MMRAGNLFDAEVSDIDYFYASRLPGEPAEGVKDTHASGSSALSTGWPSVLVLEPPSL